MVEALTLLPALMREVVFGWLMFTTTTAHRGLLLDFALGGHLSKEHHGHVLVGFLVQEPLVDPALKLLLLLGLLLLGDPFLGKLDEFIVEQVEVQLQLDCLHVDEHFDVLLDLSEMFSPDLLPIDRALCFAAQPSQLSVQALHELHL